MSSKPVYSKNIGFLSVGVWKNVHENSEGVERTYHNVTLERSYRDGEGDEYKKTNQLRDRDLGNAIALLQGVQQFLIHEG